MIERIPNPEHIEPSGERQVLIEQWNQFSRMLDEVQMHSVQLSSLQSEIRQLGETGLQKIIDQIPHADLPDGLEAMFPLERAELLKRHIQDLAESVERDIKKLNSES
jgi:hypothetical protein